MTHSSFPILPADSKLGEEVREILYNFWICAPDELDETRLQDPCVEEYAQFILSLIHREKSQSIQDVTQRLRPTPKE